MIDNETFYSSIINLKVGEQTQAASSRTCRCIRPATRCVHVDLQRVRREREDPHLRPDALQGRGGVAWREEPGRRGLASHRRRRNLAACRRTCRSSSSSTSPAWSMNESKHLSDLPAAGRRRRSRARARRDAVVVADPSAACGRAGTDRRSRCRDACRRRCCSGRRCGRCRCEGRRCQGCRRREGRRSRGSREEGRRQEVSRTARREPAASQSVAPQAARRSIVARVFRIRTMAGNALKLIVGLGNPGAEYARTRHNAGFWFVDELAREHGGSFVAKRKHQAELARVRIERRRIWLLKPHDLHESQRRAGVERCCDYYKIAPAEMLVAHDEIDLPQRHRAAQGSAAGTADTTACATSSRHCGDGLLAPAHRHRPSREPRTKSIDYVLHARAARTSSAPSTSAIVARSRTRSKRCCARGGADRHEQIAHAAAKPRPQRTE